VAEAPALSRCGPMPSANRRRSAHPASDPSLRTAQSCQGGKESSPASCVDGSWLPGEHHSATSAQALYKMLTWRRDCLLRLRRPASSGSNTLRTICSIDSAPSPAHRDIGQHAALLPPPRVIANVPREVLADHPCLVHQGPPKAARHIGQIARLEVHSSTHVS